MSGATIRDGATGQPLAAYRELEVRFARMSHLHGAKAVLHWDSATMMPPGGAEARAEQLATLPRIATRGTLLQLKKALPMLMTLSGIV